MPKSEASVSGRAPCRRRKCSRRGSLRCSCAADTGVTPSHSGSTARPSRSAGPRTATRHAIRCSRAIRLGGRRNVASRLRRGRQLPFASGACARSPLRASGSSPGRWPAVSTVDAARGSLLFHPLALGVGVLTIIVAVLTLVEAAPGSIPFPVPTQPQLIIFVILFNIVSIVHECGHGLALHRYGGSVREIGIRFVLGWPCWYCDITESYLLPHLKQRVAVIVAGPFLQAVVCAAAVLAARGG